MQSGQPPLIVEMRSVTTKTRLLPKAAAACLLLVALPTPSQSCEPIIPLYCLLSGATLVGPAMFTRSLLWLVIAVLVKCIAFGWMETRIPRLKAAWLMLQANVVSTIPGLFVAAIAAIGPIPGLVLSLPVVGALALRVGRRMSHLESRQGRFYAASGTAVVAFILLYVISVALYLTAQIAQENHRYADYWLRKFLFAALVGSTGIVLSAVLEEGFIATAWHRGTTPSISYYTSVLRANYLTLILVLLVAAIHILPARWHAPGFILGSAPKADALSHLAVTANSRKALFAIRKSTPPRWTQLTVSWRCLRGKI